MSLLNPTIDNFYLAGCYLEITSECNLRCLHCYNESGILKDVINKDTFINIMNSLPDNENTSITLSGGEPLIHPNFWDFLGILEKKHFGKALVITNATLINKEMAQKFAQHNIGIQISLNGSCSEIHDKLCGRGSFDKTMKGFNCLLNEGLSKHIIVRCVLTNFNKNNIIDLIKTLSKKNIKQIDISALSTLGRSQDNMSNLAMNIEERSKLINRLKNNSEIIKIQEKGITINFPDDFTGTCPLLMNLKDGDERLPLTPRIDSGGNVYLCQMFTDIKYSIGNINRQKLSKTVQSTQLSKLIEFFKLGQDYMHECKKCIWNSICGKGCIAIAVANGGSVQDTDGCCSIRKKYFLSSLKQSENKVEIRENVV